jgi:formamidopyrimidine-DNA glycosylase
MPEGVEVKISSELIKPLLVGKYVGKVYVGSSGRYASKDPDGLEDFNKSFRTMTDGMCIVDPLVVVNDVNTKGKFMYWSFDNDWYLFSTFGMTGQWSPVEGKHVCLKFRMHDKDTKGEMTWMHFNDPRHFGTIKFVKGRQALLEKLNELGWDPLKEGMNETWINYVFGTCTRQSKPIGELLMDQSIFAGVGNYIRAEALYLAKISPWRPANLMKKDEMLSLCQALVDVMNDSYNHQGATILTYKDAYGAEGKYSSCFKVYGQKTDPLGNAIKKETTPEGRAIHWCPAIQV